MKTEFTSVEKTTPPLAEPFPSEKHTSSTKPTSPAKTYFLCSIALMVCSILLIVSGGSGFIDLTPVIALPCAGISLLLLFAAIHAMDKEP